MKKLRCTSCGADLKLEANKEYAICEHCGTKYQLNDDLNINIKIDDDIKKVITSSAKVSSKLMLIPILVFVAIIACIVFFVIKTKTDFSNKIDINRQNNEEKIKELNEESEKQFFNLKFTSASGTKNTFFLKTILDDIINSNKVYDRKIALIFNNKSTTNESEIIQIKHSLNDKDSFEVSKNYDDDGYISEIKVEKIIQ